MVTDPPDDEEPLARPYLAHDLGQPSSGPPEGADSAPEHDVRPYLVTAGRTASVTPLALEALVRITIRGRDAQVAYEAAEILHFCRQPQSVAEVSAHLGRPVAVTRVLVGDLVVAELLTIEASATRDVADDPAFIERLMLGVAGL
jgi:hypothetical protein